MFVGIEIEGVLPVIIMHKAVNPADSVNRWSYALDIGSPSAFVEWYIRAVLGESHSHLEPKCPSDGPNQKAAPMPNESIESAMGIIT